MKNQSVNIRSYLVLILLSMFYINNAYAAGSAPIPINGFMDLLYNKLVANNSIYQNAFIPAAQAIYAVLATWEIAFETGQRMLREGGAMKVAGIVIIRISVMLLWMALIANPDWVQLIIDQAVSLANNAGGSQNLTPSQVAGMGVDIFDAFIVGVKNTKFDLWDPKLIIFGLIIVFVGFSIIILFALIGILFFITKIEATFVLSIGILMLGFLGSDWTKQWGKSYISYIIAVSIKLIVTILMITSIQNVTNDWANQVNNAATDIGQLLNVGIYIGLCTMVLFFLVLNIPPIAAGIMTGVSTAGLTNALAAGGAIMTAGAALVAGAGMAASGVMNAAKEHGIDPGNINMDTGLPDTTTGGNMAPDASSSPPAPLSNGAEGGIGSGQETNNGGGNGQSNSKNGSGNPASKMGASAYKHMENTEGSTSVNPPSMGSKNLEL